MQFLAEPPILCLSDPGKTNTFIADLFRPRLAFDDMVQFHHWSTDAAEKMKTAMQRKNCAVRFLQLVMDHEGVVVIMHFRHPLILGAAKTATGVIMRCLPEEQCAAAEMSLRPLDEVDKVRIAAWQTPKSVRPAGNKREKPAADDDCEPPAKRCKSLEAFLEDCSSEEEEVQPPRLMLTNGQHQATPSPTELNLLDITSVWEYRIKTEATVILVQVGEKPEKLAYIRCHREARRQLLLQGEINSRYRLPRLRDVVEVAMKFVSDGAFPGPCGEHGRKVDFMKRCGVALQALNPGAEHRAEKLSAAEQYAIRVALGEKDKIYEGCLHGICMNENPTWRRLDLHKPGEEDLIMSCCDRCGAPKAMGRTLTGGNWFSELDALRGRGWDGESFEYVDTWCSRVSGGVLSMPLCGVAGRRGHHSTRTT